MWWSRALLLIVVIALGPVGCGFEPLYGPRKAQNNAVGERLDGVRVNQINNRNGQMLRNALIERLTPSGEPANPAYTLTVELSESMSGLGRQKNSYATLGEMALNAGFRFVNDTGKTGFSGNAKAVVSVNFLGPRYGSVAVERDAEERAIGMIADDIRDQVAAWLADPKSKAALRVAPPRPLEDLTPPPAEPRQLP